MAGSRTKKMRSQRGFVGGEDEKRRCCSKRTGRVKRTIRRAVGIGRVSIYRARWYMGRTC